ncbi:MAG: family 43 glycosylhydrolase [Planctomycetota bacterium]|nr:family 43 glycosylhydrolase [Planctomycetota bacterium]
MKVRLDNRFTSMAMALLLIGAGAVADSVPVRNDTVWKDDRDQEIMCQGGNLCKFGDTFYFYGWGDYPGDNRKDTITCYSSRDLAYWKFERHVYTRDMTDLTLIVPDRLHVIYNAATKKYVMIGKHILPVDDPPIPGQPRVTGGVSFFTSDTPAGTFTYLGHEMLPTGASPGTDYHRDLAAFQDGDGTAYVVSSHDQHKPNRNIMITRLTPDYLKVDRAICEIPLTGVAREAPYIIKLKGKYWLFVSGHGVGGSAWNGSPTSYTTAEKLEGPWTPFKKVECEPATKDCFNAQTDFLFEVKGSAGSFVLWGGDRWSQRTKLGIGKNVWLPLHWKGDEPLLKWYPTWNVDAAAGTWTAEPKATGTPPISAVPAAPEATSTAPLMPRIAGDWWMVAGDPDLGDLTDPKQQPVDFSIWQAADGTWQLWSCIRIAKLEWGTQKEAR